MAHQIQIPPPPPLPTDWEFFKRAIGYRFDEATQTFQDGRYLNPNDPHGRYDYSQYENPIRLGAPSDGPDWQPVIQKWGLQVLDAAGFINDNNRGPVTVGRGTLAYNHPDHPIHPIFRREMWPDIDDMQWECILPAVKLASAVLDDPDTLRFFAGCWNEAITVLRNPRVGEYRRIDLPPYLNADEITEVHDAVVQMRANITFKIKNWEDWNNFFLEGCWEQVVGATLPYTVPGDVYWERGNVPDDFLRGGIQSWSSEVIFQDTYMKPFAQILSHPTRQGAYHRKHLEETLRLASVDTNRRIPIRSRPALLRTTYLFASTILHEFAHAFFNANFPAFVEPYHGDDLVNEIGWAFMQHCFGARVDGQFYAIPPLSSMEETDQGSAAPFGLVGDPHWTRFSLDAQLSKRLDGVPDVYQPYVSFPIHQGEVEKLFTEAFWEDEVQRFGSVAYRIQRNAWEVSFARDPADEVLPTAGWGHFGRQTNPMGWKDGFVPRFDVMEE